MDPDPEGSFTSTSTFKTTVLTVAFTSFYFYKTGHQEAIFRLPVAEKNNQSVTTTAGKPPSGKKKKIYLTFDDGPNKGTRNVLSIIEQEKVTATLFVVGEHVYGSKAQASIYDSASRKTIFEIANHSFTHAFQNRYKRFYELPDSVVKDFARCADSLHLRSMIIRTPGRNIWRTGSIRSIDLKTATNATDSLYQHGYQVVGWDLEWHFTSDQRLVQTSDEMVNQVDSAFLHNRTKTPDHLVLLAHDQVFANATDSASLHQFIIKLKTKEEFEFEQVSKYPGL